VLVAVVQVEIVLPEVVRSVKDQLRRHFNVSVAELDETPGLWQRATLGIGAVGADETYLRGLLTQAAQAVERWAAGQRVSTGAIEILA
jgi:uncharacterized protein YlxP (DUF503 family)